jgi:hypothetical protein
MTHYMMVFAVRLVQIMFFSGLIGCTLVVVISWISIFKEGFSDPKNAEADHH